jgi:hypothetical protein
MNIKTRLLFVTSLLAQVLLIVPFKLVSLHYYRDMSESTSTLNALT